MVKPPEGTDIFSESSLQFNCHLTVNLTKAVY